MLRANYLYAPYFVKKKKKEGTFQEEEKVFSKEDITKEDHRLNVCVSPEFIG